MAKHIQLKIDNPCHENWENMSPVEKGRFCDSCQKQVVDFTGMSDAQLAAFFKKPSTGSLCGRFMQDQLDRDMEIPRKRIPWIKYFFQFALPAFLVSARATAQGGVRIVKGDTVVCERPVMGKMRIPEPAVVIPESTIKGRVLDESGSPLESATIVIKGTRVGTVTDKDGYFNIKTGDQNSGAVLMVSYVGYQNREIKVDPTNDSTEIRLSPAQIEMLGEIVVVGAFSVRKTPEIPLIGRLFTDSSFKNIKSYPNPVSAGTMLTIECKKMKEEAYTIKLVNQLGQTVHYLETRLDKGSPTMNIHVPFLKTGNYIVSITGKDSRKTYTDKLVVQ